MPQKVSAKEKIISAKVSQKIGSDYKKISGLKFSKKDLRYVTRDRIAKK